MATIDGVTIAQEIGKPVVDRLAYSTPAPRIRTRRAAGTVTHPRAARQTPASKRIPDVTSWALAATFLVSTIRR